MKLSPECFLHKLNEAHRARNNKDRRKFVTREKKFVIVVIIKIINVA